MNQQPDAETPPERRREDRRTTALPFWHPRRLRGRRGRDRRAERDGRPYLVDRVSPTTFVMATLLLVLTITDGVITVALLDRGCEEANPVMRALLEKGMVPFFIGKYALTAAFLPIALVMDRYRLFGTRLRVGHMTPILVGLYLILLAYQFALWRRDETEGEDARRRGPVATLRIPGVRP